jgi:glutaredoxin
MAVPDRLVRSFQAASIAPRDGCLQRYRVRVATLYRCTTPTNWLCPCGKVARALEHDAIPFGEVVVPRRRSRRDEVEALTDQQRVPVLVIDREAICDSRRIIEHLAYRREQNQRPRIASEPSP